MDAREERILEEVKDFAAVAHGEQLRKFSKERYIGHPIRVMGMVKEYKPDLSILSAALLHDVLEDTPTGKSELREFLQSVMEEPDANHTLLLVEELTDTYIKSNYPTLNRRMRRSLEAERMSSVSPDAQTIKYADIIDNVVDIVKHNTDFALVYLRESRMMLDRMTKGNLQLYQRALKTTDDCMREYWDKANIKAL